MRVHVVIGVAVAGHEVFCNVRRKWGHVPGWEWFTAVGHVGGCEE